MRLRTRLALVVIVFISVMVIGFALSMLYEAAGRTGTESEGTLPWVLALLPDQVDVTQGVAAAQQRLINLVGSLHSLRHAAVTLRNADGQVLAVTPQRRDSVPDWIFDRLSLPHDVVSKDVYAGYQRIASFDVSPSYGDELAELWRDLVRRATLVVGLALLDLVAAGYGT